MRGALTGFVDFIRLLRLAARRLAGRWFWVLPCIPVLWIGFQVLSLVAGWTQGQFEPRHAQNLLIGVPLAVLAMFLGVRVIAGEMDERTLEIAYTVPGGTHRVWLAKLAAALLVLVLAIGPLAAATFFFCTSFPWSALYGALQAAVFYLVLSMGLSALSKSEATGAMLATAVLILNAFVQGTRLTPFFNPDNFPDAAATDLMAWTVQNRIGVALATVAIMLLAFQRAERREKLLGG
jgi:hypothetical protein